MIVVSQSLWQSIMNVGVLVQLLSVSVFTQFDRVSFYQPNLFHGHPKVGAVPVNINFRLD